ncbi:MAG: hypothetical protein M3270_04920 [Thermoproteota archaeon]|nr:hypothetical protein [Thermoproteota archaeon]
MATTESGDTNIRDIIQAHNQLSLTYQQIMRVIQKQRFFFCFQQQAQPAEDAKRPHVIVSLIWTFFILWGSLYFYRVRTDEAYIIRPFVKYFLESHIRRQYQRLHTIYLSDLPVERAQNQKDDISMLRQLVSDMENYSKTISHGKGVMTKLLLALSAIGTIFALFGVNFPPEFLFQSWLVEAIPRWFIAGHILFIAILSPLILAFLLKRSMFENSITQQIQSYIFIGEHESGLFPRSVYLLENRLYELLGGMEQKPKEVPVDIYMRIGLGLLLIAPTLILSMLIAYGYLQPDSPNNNNLGPIALPGFVYVVYPIMNYIQRCRSRLL